MIVSDFRDSVHIQNTRIGLQRYVSLHKVSAFPTFTNYDSLYIQYTYIVGTIDQRYTGYA
jgi:hypothetical protein